MGHLPDEARLTPLLSSTQVDDDRRQPVATLAGALETSIRVSSLRCLLSNLGVLTSSLSASQGNYNRQSARPRPLASGQSGHVAGGETRFARPGWLERATVRQRKWRETKHHFRFAPVRCKFFGSSVLQSSDMGRITQCDAALLYIDGEPCVSGRHREQLIPGGRSRADELKGRSSRGAA